MSTVDPSRSEAIALQAGAVIREEAARLKGRVVRYTAEVSERTKCLSNPRFCIGSEYGLRAVFERREELRLEAACPKDEDGQCECVA